MLIILGVLIVALLLDLLLALVLQFLYNYLAHSFGWVEVGYWQVFVVMLLVSFVAGLFRPSKS